MIDKYDIELFKHFLELAKTKGTDSIKVVAAPFPWNKGCTNQYIVTTYDQEVFTGKQMKGEF